MANLDQPQGFRPQGELLRLRAYVAAGAIYPGDLVAPEAAGRVAVWAAGAARGVALTYAAAAGDEVMVADDPAQCFIGQASAAEIDAQTDIGLNYTIVATAGSSAYRQSRQEIDSSSGDTTIDLPLKLLAVDKRPDNALGANVDCVVMINNHDLAAGTGTLGV